MGFSCLLVELIVEFCDGFILPINLHLDLAFLGVQHDRLPAELSDHVERLLRYTAQRQFLHVGRHAALHHSTQFLCNRKEPIRRTELVKGLMGAPMIVELHPYPHPLLRLLEAVELGP